MGFNRNDIAIAVTNSGELIVAQRAAQHEALGARDDISDIERGLYYSQVTHRCTAKNAQGEYIVTTPSTAAALGLEIVEMVHRSDVR